MARLFDEYLEDYAELIMKVGLNYKEGQRIRIGAFPGRSARFYTPLEAAPLVRELTTRAYQMGAPLVEVFWGDPALDLIRYQNAPRDSFQEIPTWAVDELRKTTDRKDARIYIGGSNPYLFKEIDSALLSELQKTRSETFREVNEYLEPNPLDHPALSHRGLVPGGLPGSLPGRRSGKDIRIPGQVLPVGQGRSRSILEGTLLFPDRTS